MMRTINGIAALVVSGLILAGCGGNEASDPANGAGGDAAVSIVATEFAFEPATFSLPADEDVVITLVNTGVIEHDIIVEELDDQLLVFANAGESVTESVNLPAGTYTFYCGIPGHRSAGMEGILTVE